MHFPCGNSLPKNFRNIWPASIGVQARFFDTAQKLPVIGDRVDDYLVRRIRGLLGRYGHAEFKSDAEGYKPVVNNKDTSKSNGQPAAVAQA